MKKRRNINRIIGLISGLVIVLGLFPSKVCAEENGRINVHAMLEADSSEKVYFSNTEFVLYEVGHEQQGEWELNEEYQSSGIVIDFDDTQVQSQAANKLYQCIQKQEGTAGKTEITDKEGNAYFNDLKNAVYLLVQTTEAKAGDKSYISSPALIALPTKINGSNIYNLIIEPKFEEKDNAENPPVTEEPTTDQKGTANQKTAKTGDSSPVLQLLFITAGAFTLLILMVGKVIRNNQN